MLGCTLWHPASGRELRAHNGMEQQAGRCWFHSGRTQMAEKHSSACGTGLSPTKVKSSWFSFPSVCCWKEVEAWKLQDRSRPSDRNAPRPEALPVTDMPPLWSGSQTRGGQSPPQGFVHLLCQTFLGREEQPRPSRKQLRNRLKCSDCAKRIAFIILEANQMIFFFSLSCRIYIVTRNAYSRSRIGAPCGFDLSLTVWVLLSANVFLINQLFCFDWNVINLLKPIRHDNMLHQSRRLQKVAEGCIQCLCKHKATLETDPVECVNVL